jgi:hypothetical protein
MNDRFNDKDLIDDIADEIRGQEIDDASAKDITDRVWERLAADREHAEPLTSCTDFQREIPAYIAGTLPEARALLIALPPGVDGGPGGSRTGDSAKHGSTQIRSDQPGVSHRGRNRSCARRTGVHSHRRQPDRRSAASRQRRDR